MSVTDTVVCMGEQLCWPSTAREYICKCHVPACMLDLDLWKMSVADTVVCMVMQLCWASTGGEYIQMPCTCVSTCFILVEDDMTDILDHCIGVQLCLASTGGEYICKCHMPACLLCHDL